MTPRITAALLLLSIAACASHTGVVALGNDQFMIANQQATGFPGLGNMKAEIITEGASLNACVGLRAPNKHVPRQTCHPSPDRTKTISHEVRNKGASI